MMTDFLPGLIVVLPFLAAAIIRIPGISTNRVLVNATSFCATIATTSLAALACLIGINEPVVQWIGGWEPREGTVIGIVLIADGFSAGFVALTGMLVTVAIVFLGNHYEAQRGLLHMFTLIFLGALAGFVLVGDLLTMFVFMELMAISSYIITAFKVQDDAPLQAAFNIGVVGTVGAFIFLFGAGMIYTITGTPNMAEAASRIAGLPVTPALALAFALIMVGLGIKCGFLPFHFAHIDSHSVAPAPHAGLFGAIFVQAGLFGFVRVLSIVFDAPEINQDAFTILLLAGGIITALVGASMSLVQEHLKRLLAFSSIAHLGIAGVGVGLLSSQAMAGAGLYVMSHAAVKMALFLVAGVLLHQFNLVSRGAVAGRKKELLPVVVMLAAGAMALAGAPPSGLYGGKTFIGEAAGEAGMAWVLIPLYLAAALTGAAVIRFAACFYMKAPEVQADEVLVREGSRETNAEGRVFMMTLIPGLLLVIGILLPLASPFVEGIEKAAGQDFDRIRYISLVLTGQAEAAVTQTNHELWKVKDLAKGIASAGLAVIIGLVAARRPGFGSYSKGMFAGLRQIHSGHVGDYVTWLMLGTAMAAAWLLLWL